MSIIQVRHIRIALEKLFDKKIDMSDSVKQSPDDRVRISLSRSLAAYALVHLCEISPDVAVNYITDGYEDNGIDAIFFDQIDKIVYVVQAKMDFDGNGFPDMAAVNAFIKGFQDLIVPRWDRFNAKLLKHQAEIVSALDDPSVSFELVLVHTGQQSISKHAKEAFEDLLNDVNDTSEVVRYKILSQSDLHAAVSGTADGSPIDLEVMLYDWGIVQDPYLAYYGQIEAKDVAVWWQQYGNRILSRNLRKLIPKSEVNDSITDTVKNAPEHFWYFNNGITVLCNKVSKKLIGGSDRKSGSFQCEGVSIVNGAQTVGTIGTALAAPIAGTEKARVAVRFISLEKCPQDFATSVTRATNTQNRVERRDFVSLDPQQERIRKELFLELAKEYSLKTGEPDPPVESGCSVTEATTALACAHPDHAFAVLAKRELGKLWENLDKPPYKILFNSGLSVLKLWRSVEIQRSVDNELKRIAEKSKGGPVRNTAVHGNRLIEYLVFRRLDVDRFSEPTFDLQAAKMKAERLTNDLVTKVSTKATAMYPGAYLAHLFRNVSKSKAVCDAIAADEASPQTAVTPSAPTAPADGSPP